MYRGPAKRETLNPKELRDFDFSGNAGLRRPPPVTAGAVRRRRQHPFLPFHCQGYVSSFDEGGEGSFAAAARCIYVYVPFRTDGRGYYLSVSQPVSGGGLSSAYAYSEPRPHARNPLSHLPAS